MQCFEFEFIYFSFTKEKVSKKKAKLFCAVLRIFIHLTAIRFFDIIVSAQTSERNENMKKIAALLTGFCLLLTLCSCQLLKEPREVRTVEINEKGELIVIFTDGTTTNAGMVKGDKGDSGNDGKDGIDGANGQNGQDGKDGEDGAQGPQGLMGTDGRNGRSVESILPDGNGALTVTYSDGKTQTVELRGTLYLFGGYLNDKKTATWALYSGGLLVIDGSGSAESSDTEAAPWSVISPLVSAVYVDLSDGLEFDKDLLVGIDSDIIMYSSSESTTTTWVDMAVEAPIYDTPEKLNDEDATPLAKLALGKAMKTVAVNDEYATIIYNGAYAYIAKKYVRDNPDSVVFNTPSGFDRIQVTHADGAALRWYPDAYSNNKYMSTPLPTGTILNCDGVSLNGWWYRVTYNGERLYVYKSVVTPITA